MDTANWDAAVVGAGPAGAMTALLLARAGRRVVLIDAAHFPRQKVCGEYLSAAAWQIVENLGLGELRGDAVPLSSMRLTVPSGRTVDMPFSTSTCEQPAALSRAVLDERLVRAALDAGAELRLGFRVRQVEIRNGSAVAVEAVDAADPHRVERFAAPLVIAADGRRSRVVHDTGRTRLRQSRLIGFKRHIRPVDVNGYADRIVIHTLPGGYVGVCPVKDGALNLCGMIPRDRLTTHKGHLNDALAAWMSDDPMLRRLIESADDVEPWHTMPDVPLQSSRPNAAGVLYVGDAMGTIEPLTGQGMTMALASANLAVEHLTRDGPRSVDRLLQRAYHRAWHAEFDGAIRAAAWLGRLLRRPRLLGALMAGTKPLPALADFLMHAFHTRTLTGTPR